MVVKFSVYLNRHVFVMNTLKSKNEIAKYISSKLDMKLPRKGHHYEAYTSKAPKEDIRASNKKFAVPSVRLEKNCNTGTASEIYWVSNQILLFPAGTKR